MLFFSSNLGTKIVQSVLYALSSGYLATVRVEFLLSGNLTKTVDDPTSIYSVSIFPFSHRNERWVLYLLLWLRFWWLGPILQMKAFASKLTKLESKFVNSPNIWKADECFTSKNLFELNPQIHITQIIDNLITLFTTYLYDDAIVPIWLILMKLLCE